MAHNELGTESYEVMGQVDPQSASSGAKTTGWIKADKHNRFLCQIVLGAMTATATINAKLEQANTSGGGGAKDITNKALTQVADTGGSKTYAINLRPDELDRANGFLWFRLSITPATAAVLLMGQVLGVAADYKPVLQTNWAQAIA